VRLNPQRSIGGEANLARRIERERTARGLSYEALAKLLTTAGCSIQGSAIYKIEKADPPRRITVDELVGLARVFDTTIEDLLTPLEVLDKERAQAILKELEQADEGLARAATKLVVHYSELLYLAGEDLELVDYALGHYERAMGVGEESGQLFTLVAEDGKAPSVAVDDSIFRRAMADFYIRLTEQAKEMAVARRKAERETVQ
jgi:transcriptional regulator with XRE-family HTH domain